MREKYKYPMCVIVIGLGTNGLAVVRALGGKGIPIVTLLSESQAQEPYGATKYGKKIVLDMGDENKAVLEYLLNFDESAQALIFPTTDSLVRCLSRHRAEIPRKMKLLFPEHDVVEMLINKEAFHNLAQSRGYPVPRSAFIKTDSQCTEAAGMLNFPVIAKTNYKVYKNGLKKAYVLNNPKEFKSWYNDIKKIHSEFIIQEYIAGDDSNVFFSMQYISGTGALLASFTGQKIRQWPPLTGGTSSARPYHSSELTDLTYKFFRQAGFFGIGSMEYKRDPGTGRFYMIEPTVCRTDFQEGTAIANGVNIPFVAYRDALGDPVDYIPQRVNARKIWMHLTADRLSRDALIRGNKLTYLKWSLSIAGVRKNDLFTVSDPGPLLRYVTNRLGRMFKGLRKC